MSRHGRKKLTKKEKELDNAKKGNYNLTMPVIRKYQIARLAGISPGFLSDISNGKTRPHWKTAKRLARITNTRKTLWLEGTPQEIQQAILLYMLNNSN